VSLNRDEFEVLWKVEHSWEHNPQQASNNTEDSVKKFQKIFLALENQQLLDIHIVNNEIISSEVTDKGHEILRESQYQEWSEDLKEHSILQQP
jgi:hypothetical protein